MDYKFVFYPHFPILCLYFIGASAGICLLFRFSFLRNCLITCETSVPLSNVVETDKEFQPWTVGRKGEASRAVAFALFPQIAG